MLSYGPAEPWLAINLSICALFLAGATATYRRYLLVPPWWIWAVIVAATVVQCLAPVPRVVNGTGIGIVPIAMITYVLVVAGVSYRRKGRLLRSLTWLAWPIISVAMIAADLIFVLTHGRTLAGIGGAGLLDEINLAPLIGTIATILLFTINRRARTRTCE